MCIARTLPSNPSILLWDEATSALDTQTNDSILTLLQRINEEYNITIMIITHEMSIIQKVCNKVAVMENGKIVEQGEVLSVFGNPQQKSTQEFVRTIIHDQVPTSVKNSLKIDSRSRLFKLTVADNITNPIMNHLIRTCHLSHHLVYDTLYDIQHFNVCYIFLHILDDLLILL